MEKKRQELVSQKRFRDAFVETIKGRVLLTNLKWKNPKMEGNMEKLIMTPGSGALSLKQQYETEVSALGDNIHQLGLAELAVREAEVQVFEESVEIAQKETQAKGVKTVST